MNPALSSNNSASSRVSTISAVKTPLSFFVLVVIAVETGLGSLAAKAEAHNQMIIIYLMVATILTLIAAVIALTFLRPWDLVASPALRRFASTGADMKEANQFSQKIAGHWWEEIEQDQDTSLSFVDISAIPALDRIIVSGTAYSKEGTYSAKWETLATSVNPEERKLFYIWTGHHPKNATALYQGFGSFAFDEVLQSANGSFIDTNLSDRAATAKYVKLTKATDTESETMRTGSAEEIGILIRRKLRTNVISTQSQVQRATS